MKGFNRNVFVNCPFDSDYHPLFRPLVFTILYSGFKPRIASERADSGELRLQKIRELIDDSRYSIHDLSRCRATRSKEYFRLNMPFELGIDAGCRWYRRGRWKNKRFLVLEAKRYEYQKALSDLSGADVKSHGNDPLKIIQVVRDWLVHEAGGQSRPYSEIKTRFDDFMAADYDRLTKAGWKPRDIKKLPFSEFARNMQEWIKANRDYYG